MIVIQQARLLVRSPPLTGEAHHENDVAPFQRHLDTVTRLDHLARMAAAFAVDAHMLGTILLIILILLLIGALPNWGYSRGWGYGPSGGLGLVLVIIIILVLMHIF